MSPEEWRAAHMVCAVPDEEQEERLADESFARLTIYSDTKSAEELAAALGVIPDEAWNKGDPRKRGQTHTTTAIGLRSLIADDRPPEDHLEDLLTRVAPLHDRIAGQIAEGSTVRLKVALFADTDNPTLSLRADVLRRLAAFGVDLDLDIYEV
jgi:hypothetical protein